MLMGGKGYSLRLFDPVPVVIAKKNEIDFLPAFLKVATSCRRNRAASVECPRIVKDSIGVLLFKNLPQRYFCAKSGDHIVR